MSVEISLFSNPIYIQPPQGLIGWVWWLAFMGVVILLNWQWWHYNKRWKKRELWIFLILLIALPLTNLFLIIRLPAGEALPLPGVPAEPVGPISVVFSALPWVLAAGFLGPAAATGFGLFSGLIIAFAGSHSPFTPLEFALMGLFLGVAYQQRYRTWIFRALRQPLVSALLLALLYPLLYLLDMLFVSGGSLVIRLDFALTHVRYNALAMGIELLIAGLFGQIFSAALPHIWGGQGALKPDPIERRLQTRFLVNLAPLVLFLVIALMIADWIVAGRVAKSMLNERMAGTAELAADSLPFFQESGQNLILQLSRDPRWYTSSPAEVRDLLELSLRTVPFFRQLYYLDQDGDPVAGYPYNNFNAASPLPAIEEHSGIQLALNGVPNQSYTIPPPEGESAAYVSFLGTVFDEQEQVRGVLVGRTDLASNPFTLPILTTLESSTDIGGVGLLLDEKQRIIYQSQGENLMEPYPGETFDQAAFYESTAPDGTRVLVYYQPAVGYPWAIALAVPASQVQQIALAIAAPLLALIAFLTLLSILILRWALRVITASLHNLAEEAKRIAGGELDHPLSTAGEDEVGQLRRAFEQMRLSLKARMDELNRLLLVSQGVASSLEFDESIQPVLDAALTSGACAARVALVAGSDAEVELNPTTMTHFSAGPAKELYASLDEQILALARQQDRVVLTNLGRVRLLNFTPGVPRPEAILALALQYENTFYGALWLVFDSPHTFNEDELRFLTTLAGQAALAAANSRLYMSAEVGRQRLAAILDSTPDPVLVTDQQGRLTRANPAACQVLGFGLESSLGQPIKDVIRPTELVKLLLAFSNDKLVEISLPDGRVYLATASSIFADGQRMGRVCLLRDVTRFKELDALKSEFVATVSHDLRSPLTLMRGYATMLDMVGDLNEQQTSYVRKIISSVENMARLVGNLLDLGRIEAGVNLQLEMVPVREIVERVTGAQQLQATQKRIQLTSEAPPDTVPLVEADPALLQQALNNLLDNAIKYTDPGGKITVRVYSRGDRLIFEVSDTGIGIAPVDQPRLFEKFYRGAQKGAHKQSGTGLGLAIVKSIAERHAGQVWAESQLGKGSSFYLSIPIRQPRREK